MNAKFISYNNEFAETNDNSFDKYKVHQTIFHNFNNFRLKHENLQYFYESLHYDFEVG